MINYNNHNITGISYNNHSIKYVYGCGGNLVWTGETPPVFGLKLYAEYSTSETLEIECNGQHLDQLEPQHGGSPNITYMEKVYIGGCAKFIPQNTFSDMATNLKEAIMHDGITAIYGSAFSALYKLSKVTIPNSVTTIGDGAFKGCSGLTELNMGTGVTTISFDAFSGCSQITSNVILPSIESIGDSAFSNCEKLNSVTIGSACTTIGNYAFYGCSSLKSIVIKAITPPILGSATFDGSTCPIYVPDESVEVFKDASTFWKVFKDRIKPISEKPNYP